MYLRLVNIRFLSHPFQFIIHYHPYATAWGEGGLTRHPFHSPGFSDKIRGAEKKEIYQTVISKSYYSLLNTKGNLLKYSQVS
jgi:hypothetical protein